MRESGPPPVHRALLPPSQDSFQLIRLKTDQIEARIAAAVKLRLKSIPMLV
jgi:hypothetical protein